MKVLVTGATDGIGARLVRDYLAAGHDVIATGRRPEGPEGARYVVADQTNPRAAALAIGGTVGDTLDVAILNAGTGFVEDVPEQRAAETLDVNLAATILIARAVAPAVLAANGSLVVVGSVVHKSSKRIPTYAATKGGLHGFARALAEEWRGRAHVAALHPGPTDTSMLAKAGLDRLPPKWFLANADAVARGIEHAVAKRHPSRTLTRLYCARAKGVAA